MLKHHNAPNKGEFVVELLKKATLDNNKKVRAYAMAGLLDLNVSDERKQKEFIPLILPLLNDRSKRVRRFALESLGKYPQAVPLEAAATMFVNEKDAKLQKGVKRLI
jgi:HEAT repeat protein